MDITELRIDGKRLQNTLEEMATIGATPGGGVQRLALTDEDKQARDLFVQWLQDLSLNVTIDEVGNIFGKREGTNDDLPPIVSGSISTLNQKMDASMASSALWVLSKYRELSMGTTSRTSDLSSL